MAPNVRGPDKQKRKRAAATFKQNATTQRKKHNNKLAAAAEGTARLDAFVGTRGTSQGEPKNTVPEAVDDADDAGNKVQARPHRNVSVSTTQAGDGTATRGSQQNTTCSNGNTPRTGGHAAGSESQHPQVGGCIPWQQQTESEKHLSRGQHYFIASVATERYGNERGVNVLISNHGILSGGISQFLILNI